VPFPPNLLLSPHTPAERREKFPALRAIKAASKIMNTAEQNISTGFSRRGLALSYLLNRQRNMPISLRSFSDLKTSIRRECYILGIEMMSENEARAYDGRTSRRLH